MANHEAKESLNKPSSLSSDIVIVLVPLPAQSHLNSLLQVAHAISSYNLKVHYVSSHLHNSQVKSRAANPNHNNPNIIFHDLPIPDFESPPPNKTLSHCLPKLKASLALRGPVKSLLESLAGPARRLVVIHDPLMSVVVQDACALPNAESYLFNCVSAVATFGLARDAAGRKEREDIPVSRGCMAVECQDFLDGQFKCLKTMIKVSGHLRNTSRLIESEFLDILAEKKSVKQWAIGPLETVTEFKNRATKGLDYGKRVGRCLEWLDKQEPKSVLYVSFGTTTCMEDEQIREIAVGLEQSGAKFVWVLRDADKGNIFDAVEVRRLQLPAGFEERMEESGMGMVVREWAPQLEILGHPSTGGFMSHCGWNSCLESMSLGVPIVAWPMYGDQPMNAALVVNRLKAGLDVREWKKREELVSSSEIAEVVERLMKSKEGCEIKKRAEDLGSELRKSTAKGGVSRLELDDFVAHITRS